MSIRLSTATNIESAADSAGLERKAIAVFAFLAGASTLALLVLLLLAPPANSAQELTYVADHTALVTIFEIVVIAWATLSAPFAFGLWMLTRIRSRVIAAAATGLSVVGILLLGFATYANTGALIAINAAGTPPVAGANTYLASFWAQLGYLLTDPPLMAWGLGQMFFASLAWSSRIVPRWLSAVGGIAGLGFLLGSLDTPSQAIFLIAFGFLAFAIWAAGIGVAVLRRTG